MDFKSCSMFFREYYCDNYLDVFINFLLVCGLVPTSLFEESAQIA